MTIALITGARGFVGRHLSWALERQGIHVCGLGHGAWVEGERKQWGMAYWLNGDVTKRNLDIIQTAVGQPDLVFHLAGGSSVGSSLIAPEEDFHRSVLPAVELLEWARLSAPNAKFVLASSAAVYGDLHNQVICESASMAPYSPYGFHKRIAEELFESYGKNFGLNVSIVRLFSVYGTELRKQLFWDVCGRLYSDPRCLELSGTGEELRDWFHISDAVELLQLAAINADPDGLIINGGTGIATSVRQVAEQLCNSWGGTVELKFSDKVRPGDPKFLVANVDRATSLDFVPKMEWKPGVAEYVAWFKRAHLKLPI